MYTYIHINIYKCKYISLPCCPRRRQGLGSTIYMYTCIHVYIYLYVYLSIYLSIYIYLYLSISIYIYIIIKVCMHIHIHYHVVLGRDKVLAVVAHEERETLPFLHRPCLWGLFAHAFIIYLCIYHLFMYSSFIHVSIIFMHLSIMHAFIFCSCIDVLIYVSIFFIKNYSSGRVYLSIHWELWVRTKSERHSPSCAAPALIVGVFIRCIYSRI